jgi:hypothetical protein
MGPRWALKPGLTDRLIIGHNVTLTLIWVSCSHELVVRQLPASKYMSIEAEEYPLLGAAA